MDRIDSGAPLLSLNAVVIDTETTGLDPLNARVIELAGVRLIGGKLNAADCFRQLLKPGRESIPASTTKIHGIDDAMVAKASQFAEEWPRFKAFIGNNVVIGHTVGFDLAVLKRECDLAGLPWSTPRTLDTRLLAEIVVPALAGYSLEELTSWLGVDVVNRHSALGDATTTAQVFLALLPNLRDRGIRTLAEAERACRTLTTTLDRQAKAGWIEAVEAPGRADAEQVLQRFDSYVYRHRNRDVMQAPALSVESNVTVREAITRMATDKVSSLFVVDHGADVNRIKANHAGIVTERDMLRAIHRLGPSALESPIDQFTSKPLVSVPEDAFVYRAVGRMNRLKTRHLGVVDENGVVVGALSARDLLRLRAGEAISLGDEIDEASNAHELSIAWAKLAHVAKALRAEELSGRNIAEVISSELCALTRQAGVIAERIMKDRGLGEPPSRFALLVLGSAGRGESLLAMDQDNALIFEHGDPDSKVDLWFAAFGAHVADILHEAGVPYCKGGIMAKNAPWRGSVTTWRDRIGHWIERANPDDILSVDVFFDLRAVQGEGALATAVRRAAFDAANGQVAFAKLLAEGTGAVPSSLKMFGGIRTDQSGRIDLKRAGLFGIVAAARTIAICHHITVRSTPERIATIASLLKSSGADFDALDTAQSVFLDLIVEQQIADFANGIPPSNSVELKRLSTRERSQLRRALESVDSLDVLTQDHLFKDHVEQDAH